MMGNKLSGTVCACILVQFKSSQLLEHWGKMVWLPNNLFYNTSHTRLQESDPLSSYQSKVKLYNKNYLLLYHLQQKVQFVNIPNTIWAKIFKIYLCQQKPHGRKKKKKEKEIKPNTQFEIYITKELVLSDSGYQGWGRNSTEDNANIVIS